MVKFNQKEKEMDVKDYVRLAMRTRCPQGSTVLERLEVGGLESDPNIKDPLLRIVSPTRRNTALLHGCIGLAGEAGELAEALDRWIDEGWQLDRVNLLEEIGDICWYCSEIVESLQLQLVTSITDNLFVGMETATRRLMIAVGSLSTEMQRWLFYGKGLNQEKISKALANIMYYAQHIALRLDSHIEEVMDKNIAKLRKRYPEKFTEELAAEENRDRAAERKVLENPEFQAAFEAGTRKAKAEQLVHAKGSCTNCGETIGIIATPPFSVGGVLEQTGQGWAEPPDESMDREVDSTGCAATSDRPYTDRELKREAADKIANRAQLTDGYPTMCRLCRNVAVHKNNSVRICPDCMGELKRELRDNNQNVPVTQAEKPL